MTNATSFEEKAVVVNGDPVEFLRAKLEGVKPSGKGFMARCPSHGDRTASLHVRRGDKQSVIMHCFARCKYEAIVEASGLPVEMRGNVVAPDAVFVYRLADGRPSYAVLRFPGKQFAQCTWDAKDEVVWSVKGTDSLLYDLPDLLAEVQRGGDIFVVEGEGDVETLKSHGLVATTAPGGASVKWSPDLVAALRGAKRVIIIADCDDPGRRALRQRHEVISAVVDDTRWIDLDPDRTDGFDVSGWFANRVTVDDLRRLVDGATSERPPKLTVPESTTDSSALKPTIFLKIPSDVLKRRDLTPPEKTVLSYFRRDVELSKDPKKYNGFRYDLSTRAIEEQTGMWRSKVQRAIKGLATKGFIEVQHTNGGRQKRNSYKLASPMPLPQMGLKRVHLSQAEMLSRESVNGPILGPDMDPFWAPHINRVAESSNTLGEASRSITDLEEQIQPAKSDEKIPENWRPERLACGHASPWTDESGEICCMGCDPPSNLRVIPPTAAAIRRFVASVTSNRPMRREDWK